MLILTLVDCGVPNPPRNGTLGSITTTTAGSTLTFMCDEPLIPTTVMVAHCTRDAVWDPLPELLMCKEKGK